MSGRAGTLAALAISIVALGLSGYAVLRDTAADTVTTTELDGAANNLSRRLDSVAARIDALTAPGAAAAGNAARLNGLTSEQLIRSDVVETGHFNCQGIGMWPWASDVKYTQTRAGREMTEGEGFFDRLLNLPNGATITAFRAFVHDSSATQQAACYMLAASIHPDVSGSNPAYTPESGDTATPGNTILEDTSIEPATVDNANFSYLAECWLSGPGGLALKGVSIEYEVAGRPIP